MPPPPDPNPTRMAGSERAGTPPGTLPPPEIGPELSIGDASKDPFPGIGSLPGLVWAYGIAGGAWVCALWARFLPAGALWIALAVVGAAVLVWLSLRVLPRAWRRWMAPITPEWLVAPDARVAAIVPPEELLAAKARLTRERGLFFEPELIRPILGISKGTRTVVPWVGASLIVLFLAVIVDVRLPGRPLFPRSYFPNFFQCALAFAAGGVLIDWLHPVYLTLTPGRLEVQAFGFLGRGEARVIAYDLTACRVRVNERARTFSVVPPGVHQATYSGRDARRGQGPGAAAGASLRLTPGGLEFLRRLESAALRPEGEPPLAVGANR